MRVLTAILLASTLGSRVGAECTRAVEGSAVARALDQATRCSERRLRRGPGAACTGAPAPVCDGGLVRDAVALAYGPNAEPTRAVNGRAWRRQLGCQAAIGRGVTRFVETKLVGILRGMPRRTARARARHHLQSLAACRGVRVARDPSGLSLPAVGLQCESAVGPSGRPVRVGRLRHCLELLLDAWTDRTTGSGGQHPNVVLILTDDQRWDSLPYMPTVQGELLGHGVEFTNAFATTPLCAPSRASSLTGRYAHATGVQANTPPGGGVQAFDETSTLATWLHDAGYRTGLFGKYLNGYSDLAPYVPPGWDEWHAFHGASGLFPTDAGYFLYFLAAKDALTWYGDRKVDYSTDVLAAKAIDFIRRSARTPFLLYFAPYAPHFPADPAPRHAGVLAGLPPWRPTNYNESDMSDKPPWMQALELSPEVAAETDALRLRQLESLRAVDDAVAAIIRALREEGIDRRTLVVFSSDNGFAWGEHRLRGKDCPYEECIRIPLVVRYPALAPLPRAEARLALNIDFGPTFAELAGLPLPPHADGQSLVRVLDGTAASWRADFLVERSDGLISDLAAVRSREWKYVEYRSGDRELYDLVHDPGELVNRAADPAYAPRIAELATRLRALYPAWGTSTDTAH